VDHPATQVFKRKRLTRMLGTLPSHVVFVPIDFDHQDLGVAMAAAAFRTGVRTFFIWEGVTQYITAEAVDATLSYVSRTASPGSRIVFTYIHRGVTDNSVPFPGADKLTSAARTLGAPWITGFYPDELPGYLATRGLTIVEHVGASDYQARYLNPLSRRLNVFEIERVVLAEVSDTPPA
jgi:methyltransferase (TIGR00027 family)